MIGCDHGSSFAAKSSCLPAARAAMHGLVSIACPWIRTRPAITAARAPPAGHSTSPFQACSPLFPRPDRQQPRCAHSCTPTSNHTPCRTHLPTSTRPLLATLRRRVLTRARPALPRRGSPARPPRIVLSSIGLLFPAAVCLSLRDLPCRAGPRSCRALPWNISCARTIPATGRPPWNCQRACMFCARRTLRPHTHRDRSVVDHTVFPRASTPTK